MKKDLYIYYRVPAAVNAEFNARVRKLQGWVREEYGIVPGLKRRPGSKEGRETWMEVYESVSPGFEEALERAVARIGVADLIDGDRHTEIFLDMSSCA